MIMMDLSMADSLDVGKEAAAAAKPAAAGAGRSGENFGELYGVAERIAEEGKSGDSRTS